MRHTLKFNIQSLVTLVFIPFFLAACGGSNNNKDSTPPVITEVLTTLEGTLDNYLNTNINDNDPGIAIIVMKDGVSIYSGEKGIADKTSQQAITADTGFKLASMSKLFTAIAIMQLREQGLLSPSDSIQTYLPELPASWNSITIHQLLTHQSGIPDWINDIDFHSWPDGVTNSNVIEYFSLNDELNFVPGSQAKYSNSGYILLSEIVSRLTSLSFSDYMKINIFEPLGMVNSYIIDESYIASENTALNFAKDTTQFNRTLYVNGPSGMVSSTNDLHAFTAAFLNGGVIESSSLALMRTPHTLQMAAIGNSHYGYGMVLDPLSDDIFFHGGSLDSFESEIRVNFTSGGAVIQLGNDGRGHQGQVIALINGFFN
jgi:CubicO group peptidase (beta-lactamase class C family)